MDCITHPLHRYLSDIPMPPLISPPLSITLLPDEQDIDQDDDVIYLATHTTLHAAPSPPHTSLNNPTHHIPNFDLCAKFPP